jgi:hypothetical protein
MKVLDRAQSRIPQPWRTIVDWFVTVAVAVAFVLTFQAQVAKPYRIPTPSMEPTLHCANRAAFCQGRSSDRVIANRLAYRFGDPKRGQIVVFRTPETAQRCGQSDGGSTFVKSTVGPAPRPAHIRQAGQQLGWGDQRARPGRRGGAHFGNKGVRVGLGPRVRSPELQPLRRIGCGTSFLWHKGRLRNLGTLGGGYSGAGDITERARSSGGARSRRDCLTA